MAATLPLLVLLLILPQALQQLGMYVCVSSVRYSFILDHLGNT